MFGKYKSEHALLSPRNYSAKPTRPFACVILYLCSHCVVVLSHLICSDRRTVLKQKDVGLEVRRRAVCFWLCHQLPAAPGRSPCLSLSYLETEELEDLSPSQVMVRLCSSTGVKKPRPCLEDISEWLLESVLRYVEVCYFLVILPIWEFVKPLLTPVNLEVWDG